MEIPDPKDLKVSLRLKLSHQPQPIQETACAWNILSCWSSPISHRQLSDPWIWDLDFELKKIRSHESSQTRNPATPNSPQISVLLTFPSLPTASFCTRSSWKESYATGGGFVLVVTKTSLKANKPNNLSLLPTNASECMAIGTCPPTPTPLLPEKATRKEYKWFDQTKHWSKHTLRKSQECNAKSLAQKEHLLGTTAFGLFSFLPFTNRLAVLGTLFLTHRQMETKKPRSRPEPKSFQVFQPKH